MEWQQLAYRLVFERLELGIIIVDKQNRVVDINPTAVSLLQKDKEAILGTPLALDQPGWTTLENALKQEQASKIELSLYQAHYEVSVILLEDLNGIDHGRLIALHNITQRKKNEQLLQQAKEAAEAADQAKTHFLTNMSHEIRTPLNAVVGMTEMLRQTPLNTNQSEMIDIVAHSSEELMSLINNILDFAKLEAGTLVLNQQTFDLIDCLESSIDNVSQAATQKQLQLTYRVMDEAVNWLVGDPVRLRQILINLLENSIKFTKEGKVELTVDQNLQGEAVMLQFVVEDSGIGIAAEQIQHLFSPFRQLDGSMTRLFGGNGLGLAICKRLVELMGGEIYLTSDVGRGTAVYFSTWFKLAAETRPPTISLRQHKATLAHKRLLIITKEVNERRHISKEARVAGLEVYPTASAREASYWINNSEPFDAALLDAAVWQEDPAIMSQLHKKGTNLPLPTVLLIPNNQEEFVANHAGAEQFSGYLSKPLTGALMYDMLLNVLSVSDTHMVRSEPSTTMAERHPLSILIVDDNKLNRRILENMLENLGYEVNSATNGQLAVQAAAQKNYDVILMDIQMPVMDGVETTQQILAANSQRKRPYIIAVTAHALEGDREYYLSAGMNEYVSKPLTTNRLVEVLYQAISYNDLPSSQPKPLDSATQLNVPEKLPETSIDLAELTQLVGDNINEFLKAMAPIFLEDTEHILQNLTAAVQRKDVLEIRQAAHTMKGSSASMAMTKLAQLCRELEIMSKDEELSSASQKLEQIQAEYNCVAAELTAMMETAA